MQRKAIILAERQRLAKLSDALSTQIEEGGDDLTHINNTIHHRRELLASIRALEWVLEQVESAELGQRPHIEAALGPTETEMWRMLVALWNAGKVTPQGFVITVDDEQLVTFERMMIGED